MKSTRGGSFLLRKKCLMTLSFLGNLRIGPKDIVLHYIRLEGLAMDKHSSLLGPFVGLEENDGIRFHLIGNFLVYLPILSSNTVHFKSLN
jgi:hypothetical protein